MPTLRLLLALARGCAVAGGLLMGAVALLLCASLLGRNTGGWTLVGDFELTALATGAAIALMLPWCQCTGAHVRVDFFTAGAGAATRAALDRAGAAALALLLALLAWRAGVGGVASWRAQTTSMLMALPEWWVHAALVPGLALAALVAAVQAARGAEVFAPLLAAPGSADAVGASPPPGPTPGGGPGGPPGTPPVGA